MYGITYGAEYLEQAEAVLGGAQKADDLLQGLEWLLANNPYVFRRVSEDSPLWAAETHPTGASPGLRIYYVIEEHNVVLRWLEEAP